jgi:hypothetical protein
MAENSPTQNLSRRDVISAYVLELRRWSAVLFDDQTRRRTLGG